MRTGNGAIGWVLGGTGGIVLGALAGLTWAAALRAYMVEIAAFDSQFTWWGTFGAILAPGALSGALLALGWQRARSGRASAWFAFAVAPLAVVPLLRPGALVTMFTTGLGGGAVGVVAIALLGGFALGQRGPVWLRIVLGALWLAGLAGLAATPAIIPGLPITTPRGAWVVALVTGLMLLLSIACAAPFLARGDPRSPSRRLRC
ncbi:hypothetical protein [Microbacterium mangrovi]|uniref:hypothetical protein n=1 Tax=Microbacterium mangrovi TaxID=1348253 RepID=UPI00068F0100|nr:hypothetical protein [Microbacterium mangrovi]